MAKVKPVYPNDLELVANANNLIAAYTRARKYTYWKESVQRYGIDLLGNIHSTQTALRTGTYIPKDMVEFILHERGRIRRIQSQHITDRVIQRCLNDNVMVPRFMPLLIYDNGASVTGKGPDFARDRFRTRLQKAYKEYKGKGYVLHLDFSKYFDNVNHVIALNMFRPYLSEAEYSLVAKLFKSFEIDCSEMTDEDYNACVGSIFNATLYHKPTQITGVRMAAKSIGIGNQISQITGVYYPHRIDNYCKIVEGLKYYGRYMDDSYIILDDKKRLETIYENIKKMCKELGIFVNETKTYISKLIDWHTFLKINFKVLPTTRVIRKIHSTTIRRERNRLRKFRVLLNHKRMSLEDVVSCFKSWYGVYKKYDSGYKLKNLKDYFYELFPEAKNLVKI